MEEVWSFSIWSRQRGLNNYTHYSVGSLLQSWYNVLRNPILIIEAHTIFLTLRRRGFKLLPWKLNPRMLGYVTITEYPRLIAIVFV